MENNLTGKTRREFDKFGKIVSGAIKKAIITYSIDGITRTITTNSFYEFLEEALEYKGIKTQDGRKLHEWSEVGEFLPKEFGFNGLNFKVIPLRDKKRGDYLVRWCKLDFLKILGIEWVSVKESV